MILEGFHWLHLSNIAEVVWKQDAARAG